VLAFECARHEAPAPPALVIDVRRLAQAKLTEAPEHELEALAEHLELEDAGNRNALAKAVIAWKVLEECLERAGGLESDEAMSLLITTSAPITIEAAHPRVPHLSPRLRALRNAAAAGESVTILYGGADAQPARLPVAPRFFYERRGKAYMEGECESSGQLKTYLLERVRKVLTRMQAK
jgi:DNA polymerase III epsilon subunit-like protein